MEQVEFLYVYLRSVLFIKRPVTRNIISKYFKDSVITHFNAIKSFLLHRHVASHSELCVFSALQTVKALEQFGAVTEELLVKHGKKIIGKSDTCDM